MDDETIKELIEYTTLDGINAAVQDDGGELRHLRFDPDGTPHGVVAFPSVQPVFPTAPATDPGQLVLPVDDGHRHHDVHTAFDGAKVILDPSE